MTDRELLEKAAKAAGIDASWRPNVTKGGEWFAIRNENGWIEWNPLNDDVDAFRLAVKLQLQINIGTEATFVNDKVNGNINTWAREQHKDSNPEIATRRAIVRVAARLVEGE
jgi:hypothetical protein